MRFYTTSIAVRDLDEVRAALGFDQIDLYGGSYGTRVAELYMRRYPAHVHAVILDGVTYPQQAIGAETPQDAERALNLIMARCLRRPIALPLIRICGRNSKRCCPSSDRKSQGDHR